MGWFLFTVDADWVPGSDRGLEALLDLCGALRVRSTIFTTAKFAMAYPDLISDAQRAGHEIGAHGWQHPMPVFKMENYRTTSVDQRRQWLGETTAAIAAVIGQAPQSFRAPFLWTDGATMRLLDGLGYATDSSIPTRRFDGLMGMVNHLNYFWASLEPYHPDYDHPGRKGSGRILEIPPSAFMLPLNMSTLRFVGMRGILRLARLISRRSSVLNFYCHPWEFVNAAELEFPPGTPSRHTRGLGPRWLLPLRAFLGDVLALGHKASTMAEVASCGSW